ncbi:MAG: xanthine dehydrogenase family protein subunit M [Rhodospirillaceae bacterium]|nr:xanthine dehydrogenase family protein subunit M [Rhodospirillaceae bacterium]
MQLHWPETIGAALDLLAEADEARAISGGATLVAMMNAGLVAPQTLVFLRRIPALAGIERRAGGALVVGATTTHEAVETSTLFDPGQAIVRLAAATIAHPPIRAVGTIGGSVAHADPSSDYPAALVAADAEIVCLGRGGERRVPARDFFVDFFETALLPGEIVRAVVLPPAPAGACAIYDKLARVEGDYATVSVAVVMAMEGEVCRHARLAAGACGPVPVRSDEAEALLVGATIDDAVADRAAAAMGEAADPVDDVRGSAGYRRRAMVRMMKRAILAARDGSRQ